MNFCPCASYWTLLFLSMNTTSGFAIDAALPIKSFMYACIEFAEAVVESYAMFTEVEAYVSRNFVTIALLERFVSTKQMSTEEARVEYDAATFFATSLDFASFAWKNTRTFGFPSAWFVIVPPESRLYVTFAVLSLFAPVFAKSGMQSAKSENAIDFAMNFFRFIFFLLCDFYSPSFGIR
ncbi:MAG: hypothetical protein IKN34_10345 [Treponema sp.]|nr:hypothetical protein [Treponema sp.]